MNQHIPSSQAAEAQQALDQGLAWHQAGELERAMACYQQVLAVQPQNVPALSNLGGAYHMLGGLAEAVSCYEQALAIQPNDAQTLHNLGQAQQALGQLDDAILSFQTLLRVQPDAAELHHQLGHMQSARGQWQAATDSFKAALALQPESALFLNSLGNLYMQRQKPFEALACYRQGVAFAPDSPQLLSNLGNLLETHGQLEEAIAHHQRATAVQPDYAEGYCNLSNALRLMGRLDESVACARKAIALRGDFAEAYNHLGNALKEQGALDDAGEAYRKAMALKHNFLNAISNLGNIHYTLGRFDEAVACYREVLAVQPDNPGANSNLLLCQQYMPGQSLERLYALHRSWGSGLVLPMPFPHRNDPNPDRRLRIGLSSPDLGQHPVGYLMAGFLAHYPPDELEIIVYSDRRPDTMTKQLEGYAHQWHFTLPMAHDELARRIHADGIDILMDLAGHTAHNRMGVFAQKPAPVQIAWCGYVSTTGLPTMDWMIGDRHAIAEEEQRYYTERIITLPHAWLSYTPPSYAPPVSPRPLEAMQRGFVLGNFGNPSKINGPILETWSKILQRLPHCTLWLMYNGMDSPFNVARIHEVMARHGVAPSRVILEGARPHEALLAQYNGIDLALDTQPYSGGLTTLEALWMGVPMVTVHGETFASRHATSFLKTLGLDELVCRDLAAYVERVVALASDPARLVQLRSGLRERMADSPICDQPQYARDVSDALRGAWHAWVAAGKGAVS
ncbi:MAG: tetratricopeptide repeat protein [Magnetococcales bacterium]|nr:tetratricopeptide repeat protein [Magnetococcales bacterium]